MTVREVEWFLRELGVAWASMRPGDIAALHDEPCILASPKGSKAYADRAVLERALTKRIAWYRAHGIAQVELEDSRVEAPRFLVSAVFATVQGTWRLWTPQQTPLVTHHTTQILRRTAAGWRVCTTAYHDEAQGLQARLGT